MSKCVVISGSYFPVFSPNTGKYGPEITPYLDTFHEVKRIQKPAKHVRWNVSFTCLTRIWIRLCNCPEYLNTKTIIYERKWKIIISVTMIFFENAAHLQRRYKKLWETPMASIMNFIKNHKRTTLTAWQFRKQGPIQFNRFLK